MDRHALALMEEVRKSKRGGPGEDTCQPYILTTINTRCIDMSW